MRSPGQRYRFRQAGGMHSCGGLDSLATNQIPWCKNMSTVKWKCPISISIPPQCAQLRFSFARFEWEHCVNKLDDDVQLAAEERCVHPNRNLHSLSRPEKTSHSSHCDFPPSSCIDGYCSIDNFRKSSRVSLIGSCDHISIFHSSH